MAKRDLHDLRPTLVINDISFDYVRTLKIRRSRAKLVAMRLSFRQISIIILCLWPILILWRCLFLGEIVGPWDQIMHMSPWNGPKPQSAWDVLQADGVLQFYPWRDLVLDSWSNGQIPLWNPYQLAGTPLLANSQSAPFYPLHILFGICHLPTPMAITLLAWIHLALASVGAWFLARTIGASENGALIAGGLFGMSPFLASWLPLASVVTTCSWIPWACAFTLRSIRSNRFLNPAGAMAGFCTGMMLLGGHLQFAAYGLIAILVTACLSLFQIKPQFGAILGTTLAICLGCGLSAPQVLPALAFSKISHRQVKVTSEGLEAYLASKLGLDELTGIVFPSATGVPLIPYRSSPQSEPLPSYFPAYTKRGAAFAEGAIGVSPIAFACLFLVFGRSRIRENLWGICLAIVGLLLALGPLSAAMYLSVPGWANTGSPGRAAVLVILALSVLAGCLWKHLEDNPSEARNLFLGIGAGLALTVVLIVVNSQKSSWIPGFEGVQEVAFGVASFKTLLIGVPLLLSGFVAYFAQKSKSAFALTGTLLASAFCATLCCPMGKKLPNPIVFTPEERIAIVNQDWDLLAPAKATLPGNLASVARIHELSGYDSLLSAETLEILRKVNSGQDPAPPANGNMMFIKSKINIDSLRDCGVSRLLSQQPIEGLGEYKNLPSGLLEYSVGGHRISSPSGDFELKEDGYDHQMLYADGPGIVTIKDRNLPGWEATVDRQKMEILPGPWRQVKIGSGRHRIVFRYHPPGLRNGFLVFAVAIAILSLSFVMAILRKNPEPENDQDGV